MVAADFRKVQLALLSNNLSEAANECQKGFSDLTTFFANLRKSGVLRFSNYWFSCEIVQSLAEHLLRQVGGNCEERHRHYLASVIAIGDISKEACALLRRLGKRINARSYKTYFASLDALFLNHHAWDLRKQRSDWRHFAIEELAEGFSLYTSTLWRKKPPGVSDLEHFKLERAGTDHYLNVLKDFSIIRRLIEAEILIEHFDFVASCQGREVHVDAPDPLLEKAIRLGYIFSQFQKAADTFKLLDESVPSIAELAETLVESGDIKFDVTFGGFEAIRVVFPNFDFFRSDALLREEVVSVNLLARELFISSEQLMKVPVHNGITLFDIIRFQRVLIFLAAAIQKYCEMNKLLGKPAYHNSMMPIVDADYVDFFDSFFDRKKTDGILSLLTFAPDAKASFDVQYQPIVEVEGRLIFPLGIITRSNLGRNVLQNVRFRFDNEGTIDPVGCLLEDAFKYVNVSVARGVGFNHKGTRGEIDVLAVSDDVIFVFECKNSLLPCNTFELRQSLDHLNKAVQQLSRVRGLLADFAFRDYLQRRLNFPSLTRVERVVTCVVMANRMFSGYRKDGHSVQPIYGLCNMIKTGTTESLLKEFELDGKKLSGRMLQQHWRGDHFQTQDLVDYLENDSVCSMFLESMIPRAEEYSIGRQKLVLNTFHLATDQVAMKLLKLPRTRFVPEEIS